MIKFSKTFVAAVFTIGAASIYPSMAISGETESCIAMVEEMVGVDASEKVKQLCAQGKSKEAMQSAMMGD